jgi:hypothetical protein
MFQLMLGTAGALLHADLRSRYEMFRHRHLIMDTHPTRDLRQLLKGKIDTARLKLEHAEEGI